MIFDCYVFFRVGTSPKSAKLLLLDLSYLRMNELNSLVVHCPTIDDLRIQSEKYSEFVVVIACTSEKFIEIAPILPDISFDTLYILNVGDEMKGSSNAWWNKTIIVYNEKQLMRHLCTKSMLCYYNEGLEHRKNGDIGLSNACMRDALLALDYSAQFI